jgi:nuclear pore complex protein Nup188
VTDVGGSSIPVKASRKDLATRLAATAGISPVDAYVVVDGFMQRQAQKGGDEQTGEEQWYSLLDWYEEECLALPAVSTELLDLAATTDDEAPEWIHIGVTEVGGWPEADEHIKQLFIGWRNLAQRAITEEQRRDNHGLYWFVPALPSYSNQPSRLIPRARLQLEIQVQTLNILFLRLYRANDRTAATAEALLRAAVLSGFGTEQANRDVWEGDRACGVLADRIRDMLTLIALDAMCLGLALEADLDASLLGDGDVISRVQMFLANQTQFLHGEEANAAETPVALLLVAWAFILQHLPEDRQPPTSGYDQPIHQVMLNRAFRAEAGLIPFMEQLVAGPILTDPTDSTLAVFTRKAFKDLLIAYGHVVPEHRTQGPDAIAINMMWSNLYASGGPKTALTLASDFWVTYAHDAERVNVLETDFPLDPVSLPRLLAACSGITSPNATASELASDEVSSIRQTYDQFAELWGMTVPTPDHFYRSRGTTAEGDELVVAAIDIVLPGEVKLLRGLQGQIVRVEGDSKVVKWHVQYSGWRVLLEVLKVAVGMRELGEVINTDRTEYAVENLGITRPTPAVLASGLALFSVVLKPISGLAEWLLQDLNGRNGNGMALEILLAIAISVLTQHAGSSDGATDDDVAAVLSSIDILTSLVHISPEVAFNTFRRTQFFALPSKRSSPACSLIQKDGRGTTHAITLASLRLVRKMCEVSVQYPAQVDETVLRSALHHVNVDIWQEMAGWQYETDAMRQDLAVAVCGTFEAAIIHPFGSDGKTLGAAAKSTVELFIHTATGSTYKPLAELLTSHAAGSTRRTRKKKNSKDDETRRAATSMLSALLRIAIQLGTPATVLPASLLTSAGVYRNERLPIIDILLSSAIAPSADSETSTALLRCISTYLDTTALMPSKISLASQLTDVQKTCSDIANLAASAPTSEQRIAGWKLLSSIMLSQPGAHIFCIGSAGQIAQPLEIALNELEQGEEMLDESADILAALLVFLLAVIGSPALFSVSDAIHQRDKLWKAVFAIAIRNIPTPPTFTLSRHADDFATDITAYAYMTQARATAVAVLAVEVDLLAELEGEMETTGHGTEETVIKQLLISEYRSAAKLGALAHAAVRNGCEPEEHVAEEAKLQERGVAINAYRTMQSPAERSYGTRYFYGEPNSVFTIGTY